MIKLKLRSGVELNVRKSLNTHVGALKTCIQREFALLPITDRAEFNLFHGRFKKERVGLKFKDK